MQSVSSVDNGSEHAEHDTSVGSKEVNPQAGVRIAVKTSRVPQAKTKYTSKITEYGKNHNSDSDMHHSWISLI